MGKIERISVSVADRERLERLVRDRNKPQKVVWRGRMRVRGHDRVRGGARGGAGGEEGGRVGGGGGEDPPLGAPVRPLLGGQGRGRVAKGRAPPLPRQAVAA